MYVFLDIYLDPDTDDESQHYVLLHLKAHYQEYKRMSKRTQDLLAPVWGSWHAALLIEGRSAVAKREPTAAERL
jgi:hypothetical protein